MLASTRLDLVPNVDTHIVLVPSPAGLVPTPMPFVFGGIVLGILETAILALSDDIARTAATADLIAGSGDGGEHGAVGAGIVAAGEFALQAISSAASLLDPLSTLVAHARGTSELGHVKINGLWATKAGDSVTNLLVHQLANPLPLVPPPSNSADLNFGALMVFFESAAPVRFGEMAMSCSTPVHMPTAVIALPKGYPVLILRPSVPDPLAVANHLLGQLRGLVMRRIGRTRWMRGLRVSAKRLAGRIFGPGRARSWARDAICHFTGEPVDVSTGRVVSEYEDFRLPGPIPLVIARYYDSSLAWRHASLGHGWHLSLDQRIWQEAGRLVVRRSDGREVELDTLGFADGELPVSQSLRDPVDGFVVHRTDEHVYELHEDGMVEQYAVLVVGGDARIQRRRDAHSLHAIDYGYDDEHELAWVRDSAGRRVHVEHDSHARITAIKVPIPDGRGWVTQRRYRYDEAGDLVRVDDTRGASWTYAYVAHLKVRKTDRTGLSWLYEYDGCGPNARCTRTWGSGRAAQQDGLLHRVLHYTSGKTIVEDGEGRATIYTMGDTGLVSEERDPLGRVSLIERDPSTAAVSSLKGTNGLRTRFDRDAEGRVVAEHTEFAPERWATSRMTYDAGGRLTQFVNSKGLTWSWRYDWLGRPIEESGPVGSPRRMEWDRGLLVRSSEGELSTEFVYDDMLNLGRVRSLRGEVRYQHDNLGRVRKVVSPQGGVIQHRYDSEGCLVELESLAGVVQRARFDGEDNLIELQDATRFTRWTYGNFHEVVARHEGDASVEFAYDTEGLLRVVRNEHREEATYEYDALARIKAETGFDGARRVYVLSKEGPATHITMPSGAYQITQLDHAGRVIEKRHSDATFTRYAYNDDGQLIRAENENGVVELVRDELGRVREERLGEQVVSSRFLPDGTRGSMQSSFGARVEIHRDIEGLLKHLRVGEAEQFMGVSFAHDALGSEVSRAFDNGIEHHWRRDLAGRPTMHQTTRARDGRGRETIESRGYNWRGEDQIAALEDWRKGARHFEHDARGRLIRERRPLDANAPHVFTEASQERAADAVGNVYKRPDRQDRAYAPGGLLKASDKGRYEHDADGNVVRKITPEGTWHYRWSGHGLLREVERPDAVCISFQYDAFARRIEKRVTSKGNAPSVTKYVWDGDNLIHEFGPSDARVTWHWHPDSFAPIARETTDVIFGSRFESITTDHLDTPTELYDAFGNLTWKAQLDLFGVCTIERGSRTQCPFRWPGQYEDEETGLYYNRFRYYDPSEGVYVSQDPIRLAGGLALYGYAADPLCEFDPFGLAVIVIGEDQAAVNEATRTLRAAGHDAESMQVPRNQWGGGDPRVDLQNAVNWNERWMAGRVRAGDDILDIGLDPNRITRSVFYAAEQRALATVTGSGQRMRLKKLPGGETIEEMRSRMRGGCR